MPMTTLTGVSNEQAPTALSLRPEIIIPAYIIAVHRQELVSLDLSEKVKEMHLDLISIW